MLVNLPIEKNGRELLTQTCDTRDAESFGRACGEAWSRLRQAHLDRETSGALMEHLDDSILDQLRGATITLRPGD